MSLINFHLKKRNKFRFQLTRINVIAKSVTHMVVATQDTFFCSSVSEEKT